MDDKNKKAKNTVAKNPKGIENAALKNMPKAQIFAVAPDVSTMDIPDTAELTRMSDDNQKQVLADTETLTTQEKIADEQVADTSGEKANKDVCEENVEDYKNEKSSARQKLLEFFKFGWFIRGWKKFFTKDKNRWIKIMMSVSILLIMIGSIFASSIQSDFGKIQVKSINIPTQNGQMVAGDLFKPKNVNVNNKAPLIIVVPGFQRTKETQVGVSLELARRGFVVLCFDPYNQGDSTSTESSQSATTEGYGLFALIEYFYNTDVLNYIDKDRICATGHSAGGNAAIRAAAYFGANREEGKDSKLHSIYISGYLETVTDAVMRDSAGTNMALGYALYDEGAYRTENANDPNADKSIRDGDMRYAKESLRFVNSVLSEPVTEVDIGKVYGHPAERTVRMVFNEKTLHALQPYDMNANAHIVEFFQIALDWDGGMSTYNQTWLFKEFFTLLSLIGAFLIILPLAALFLKLPFFKSCATNVPAPVAKKNRAEKAIWWATIILGMLIAGITFIPFCNLSISLFPEAAASRQTWIFPQRMTNAVMMWAALNGLIGIILFIGHYLIMKRVRKNDPTTIDSWGVKIKIKDLLKTILLAILIFASLYMIISLVFYFFHVDFRFMFISMKPIQPIMLKVLLMYIPFFFIFYFSNSLRVNGSFRIEGQKPWKSLLTAGFANTGGLILVLLIQYITFAATGTIAFTRNAAGTQLWLYVNMLFSLTPMMFILPYFSYYFFKLTGRTYLGPMVTCLIFILMSLSNSVMYIPLL